MVCKIWAVLLRLQCVTKCRNISTASQLIMDNSFWHGPDKSLMGNVRHNVGNYAEINQMVLTCVYKFTLKCTCQVSRNPCQHNQSLTLCPRDHPEERLYVVFINPQETSSAYAIPHEFLENPINLWRGNFLISSDVFLHVLYWLYHSSQNFNVNDFAIFSSFVSLALCSHMIDLVPVK